MNFQWLPLRFKTIVRLTQRRLGDALSGRLWHFSKPRGSLPEVVRLVVNQPIRKSYLFENKINNLLLGAGKINNVVIFPQEIFSFWQVIGDPSERHGYKTGRNIIGGVVQESVGGGLCQLSSILYQCSITAGLLIIERYNHTVDIYQESERVAPLGADATVVYGYKDLRIFNNLSVPIQFHVSIDGELIECQLKAAHDLRNKELDYLRRVCENHIEVDTVDRLTGQLLAHSTYVRAPHS